MAEEENLLLIPPDYKLFKEKAIYVGTFLGGPLVAGYLTTENFRQLGERAKVKTAWAVSVVATVVIFGAIFLIPELERIPRVIIPLFYALLAKYCAERFQGTAIKSHIQKGGQTYSQWRAVWISLIGAAITFGILLVVFLIVNKESFY